MGIVSLATTLVVAFAVGLQHLGGVDPASLPAPIAPVVHAAKLTRFYGSRAPEKIAAVPATLERYAGREAELYRKLASKYNEANDHASTWRVDALSTLRALVELGASAASRRSAAAADFVAAWRAQPTSTKVARAAAAALGLAYASAPGDARARLRNLCLIAPAVTAAFVGPSPDRFSLRALASDVAALGSTLDAKGRAWAVGAATTGAATLRPNKAPVLLLGLAAGLLATNPALDAPAGPLNAAALAATGLVRGPRDGAAVLAAAQGHHFRVRDFAVLSVVTCSEADTWTSPVLAAGAAGFWQPFGAVAASSAGLRVEAPVAPLYLAPLFLAVAAWVALKSFDAPSTAAI